MTDVSVLIPWRPGCPWRAAARSWVRDRYAAVHPDWEIVEAEGGEGPFSRSQAIRQAFLRSSGDVLVVADADVWCDPAPAVANVDEPGWSIPHRLIHRLTQDSTVKVLRGEHWRGLPLSTDNPQDSKPYVGHETGTLVVLRREVLADVPPDPRFVGWGQEDDAWAIALRTLVGAPWRGTDDVVHLWHPAQPRQSRRVGSPEGQALFARYKAGSSKPAAIRALLAEAA